MKTIKCNKCEYYYESKISILYTNNKEIDLGVRLIECGNMRELLISTGEGTVGMGDYTNEKCNKTAAIGLIRKFDVDDENAKIMIMTIKPNSDVMSPDWCPKKQKQWK